MNVGVVAAVAVGCGVEVVIWVDLVLLSRQLGRQGLRHRLRPQDMQVRVSVQTRAQQRPGVPVRERHCRVQVLRLRHLQR
jgi:hypothetical protein